MAITKSGIEKAEQRFAFQLVLPVFAVIVILIIFPLFYNLVLSFKKVSMNDIGESLSFAGFTNYSKVLKDREFWRSFGININYSILSAVFSTAMGLWCALVFAREFKAQGIVQGIILMPYIAPVIAIAFVWQWLLNPVYGIVNYVLTSWGIAEESIAWINEEPYAFITVILFQIWRYFSFSMLLILARIKAIPASLYEAAQIDGANPFQTFMKITLPELMITLGTVMLLRLIWAFNKFDDIYLLTSGAAGTRTLSLYIYDMSFSQQDIGSAAATSILIVILMAITLPMCIKRIL